ncbi:hypothetical protein ACFQVA_16520 [Actinomadura keratinilytica]
MGVTYKYFGAPNGATAARVPLSMRPEELGGDELGMGGMFTRIKPETVSAMVLTGIEGIPLHRVPPLELVVLHPDYAVVKLPMTVVDPSAASARNRSARPPSSGPPSPTAAARATPSTSTNSSTNGRTSPTGSMRRGTSRTAWCGPSHEAFPGHEGRFPAVFGFSGRMMMRRQRSGQFYASTGL